MSRTSTPITAADAKPTSSFCLFCSVVPRLPRARRQRVALAAFDAAASHLNAEPASQDQPAIWQALRASSLVLGARRLTLMSFAACPASARPAHCKSHKRVSYGHPRQRARARAQRACQGVSMAAVHGTFSV